MPNTSEATASPDAAPRAAKLRLGDVLVEQNVISAAQLTQALELQRATGKKLGRILIEANLITEEALAHVLARQLRAPFVNLRTFPLKADLVRLLPETPARRFKAVVLEERNDTLLVAMADPLDLFGFDEIAKLLKRRLAMAVVAESQLAAVFDKHYRRSDEISGLAKALEKDLGDAVDFGALTASVGQEGAPVVRLLQSVFEDATRAGASDVHIEPQEGELQIRNRVDGLLQTLMTADLRIAPALAQRLKLMAGLDISEKRLPQDGRFSVRLSDRTLDVRLSTMPSQYGESVVMRLLGQGSALRRLHQLGLPEDLLTRFRELLGRDSGMILVTGPTGSGKTSTLYAALAELDAQQTKIITVEDPVEYRLPGLTQVQVNEKIELSFSRVLRAALRQDPDVILVGEMRDAETAEIGLRAAITGHLLLSTLHTKDTLSTPFRLLDMGAPPFMVATSLQAVMAQRLLRAVCPHCAEPHEATPQELAWLRQVRAFNGIDEASAKPVASVSGRGCAECHGTGYHGRVGVYEMLEIDPEMALAIQRNDAGAFLTRARQSLKGKTLADRSLGFVLQHRTTLAEAMRISVDAE